MERETRALMKRHAFGARGDVRGALGWLDEGTLMYPVGKAIALHSIATNNQRFLEASHTSTGITTLAVSGNRKFIAVAEGGASPQIQIIDTTTRKRRKVLTVGDLGSDKFVSMAFSADGRHLVTQGGAPHWRLFYWNWERSKPLASISIATSSPLGPAGGNNSAGNSVGSPPDGAAAASAASPVSSTHGAPLVTNVAVCPGDALTVTVSGIGLLRFYRYTDGILQPQASCGYPREQQEIFLNHAWLDGERLVASTKRNGGLVLIEGGRYAGRIAVPRSRAVNYTPALDDVAPTVNCITATRKGFVTGSSDGAISVYERNADGNAAVVFASGDQGNDEDGDDAGGDGEGGTGSAARQFERLCTLQVPQREPGEPTEPAAPRRGDGMNNSRLGSAGRRVGSPGSAAAGTGAVAAGAATAPGAAAPSTTGPGSPSAAATVTGTGDASSMLTRSGKPRRFQVMHASGVSALNLSSTGGGASVSQHHRSPGAPAFGATLGTGGADGKRVPSASGADSVQDAVAELMGLDTAVVGYSVASMALDQGEESLAVLTSAGKIYALDFRQHWAQVQRELNTAMDKALLSAGSEPSVGSGGGQLLSPGAAAAAAANAAVVAGAAIPGVPSFQPICEPFHSGAINGMSCSVRKPFLLTSSADHSVRIWNTATHKMEMCVFFKDEPGPVAIHPSGLMAVICFHDCVRVMSVLWNSLRDRRTINFRHATAVSFSHGGQFFAISHGNLVDVFRSATCEPHGQLRGHPQKVRDLKWCSTSPYPTDNRLITCSMDGMVMYWSSQDSRKEAEHSDTKRYQYVAVAADDRYVWVVGAPTSATALEVQWKVTLREMDRHMLGSPSITSEDFEFTDTALTSLLVAPHQRMLFGGGDDGSLKVMTLPLPAGVQEAPLSAHAARITQLALSHDESTLFTAGADGSIFIWEVRDGAGVGGGGGGAATAAGLGGAAGDGAANGLNEVLVTQQELEEQRVEADSLRQTIEKLKTDIDSEEKRRNHEQGTRVRERMEEFKGDAATLAKEYASLWNGKAEQERAFIAVKLEKDAEAAREMELVERAHQSEVQELEALCNELQRTLDTEQTQHADDLDGLGEQIVREEKADNDHYVDLVSQKSEVLEKLRRQVARARQTNQETLHQLELDTDAEAQEESGRHQKALNALRQRFLHMKGEAAIMRKNAVRMEREVDVRTGEIRLLDSARAALTAQLGELSQRMSQLHQDIDERDVVIGEKEKTIYALKKHNQELEKFKFVLDHRIRQLKAQMEPKQREIVQHNLEIKARNGELESLHENSLVLRKSIEDLKNDLAEQQRHTKQLLKSIKDFESYRQRYLRDVGEIAPVLQEPAKLRQVAEQLYQTHVVARGGQRIAAADPRVRKEFVEQLEYLTTSVGALRKKVKADQERHKKEVSAMMTENLALIKEIHALRAEINELRGIVAAEEAARRTRGGASSSTAQRQGATATADKAEFEKAEEGDGDDGEADAGSTGSPRVGGIDAAAAAVKARFNPMPSSSAPHPRVPGAAAPAGGGGAGKRLANRAGAADSANAATAKGRSSRAPPLPKAIMDNRTELRMLRAYVEALERALSEAQRPPSGGQRLPPITKDTV